MVRLKVDGPIKSGHDDAGTRAFQTVPYPNPVSHSKPSPRARPGVHLDGHAAPRAGCRIKSGMTASGERHPPLATPTATITLRRLGDCLRRLKNFGRHGSVKPGHPSLPPDARWMARSSRTIDRQSVV